MQIRDRAKQTAVVVSDTSFTLDSGTAVTGYRTLRTAYAVPTIGAISGTVTWHGVPLLVTTSTGAWQIVTCDLQRDGSDVLTLINGVVTSTSTGAALGLTATSTVTIEVIASEASLGLFSIKPRPVYTEAADGTDSNNAGSPTGLAHPHRAADALLAIGPDSQASGTDAIAIGLGARAGTRTVAIGVGARGAGEYSSIIGGYYAANGMLGEVGSGIGTAKFGTVDSASQHARCSLNGHTTDATPGKLGFNYGAASAALLTGSDALYMDAGITVLDGYISAVDTASGDAKVWKFHITVQTALDWTTTTVQASSFTEDYESAGSTAWAVGATADSATNTISLDVTGEAAKNIVWAASFDTHYHWIYV